MSKSLKVGLYVTCLVDSMRPNVAFAAAKLLTSAGCEVIVPKAQTCCGQPNFNNGDLSNSKKLAIQVIDEFEQFDYLVAPSGSCLGMIKVHYLELFEHDPEYLARAKQLADKCYEIISFLHDVLKLDIDHALDASVTYHDSCSGLRELGIKTQPRALLNKIEGLKLIEMEDSEICCGFGGSFCVKYPEISTSMVNDKLKAIKNTGAEILLAGDLGCLMNIAGRCQREDIALRCFHTVEVLAGMADGPAIGEKSP